MDPFKWKRSTRCSGAVVVAAAVTFAALTLTRASVHAFGGESAGCVTTWQSIEDDEHTQSILRGSYSVSDSPERDFWGYAEWGVADATACSQYWYQETVNTQGKHLLISGFWGSLAPQQIGPK